MIPQDITTAVSAVESFALLNLANGKLVLELGADKGHSTICLAHGATKVFSVDWHRGDAQTGEQQTLAAFLENVQRYGLMDKVIAVLGRFEDVAPIVRSQVFDLIFLDGAHDRDSVMRDISHFFPALTEGGVIAFHDYGRFDVTDVVDEFVARTGRRLEVVDHLAICHPR